MNIIMRHSKNLMPVLTYILAFYCFSKTNIFLFFENLLGSFLKAILAINLGMLLIAILVIALQRSVSCFLSVASLIFLFPSVISLSKMNWFEKILGLNFTSTAPLGLVAITSTLLVVGIVVGGQTIRLDKRVKELEFRGANTNELEEVYSEQNLIISNSTVLVLSITSFVIIIGFFLLPYLKIGMEPPLLLLFGSIIASATVIYFIIKTYRKK